MSSLRERERALRQGAISYLNKPISKEALLEEFTRIQKFLLGGKRSLLVVDDEPMQRDSIVALIGDADLRIVAVDTGQAALDALREARIRLHGAGPDAARHQRLRPARHHRQG
jgi:CheY-like chemotaxis protein